MTNPSNLRQEIEELISNNCHEWNWQGEGIEQLNTLIDREKRAAVEEFVDRFNKENDYDNGISIEDGSTYDRIVKQLFPPQLK